LSFVFFFQAEDGIRDFHVTGVQTCALPIFVSIMGSGGEHFAVGVYLGTEALMGFWMMQQMPAFDMEMFLSFRQLQLSFEDREIRSEERRVGKECGSRWWLCPRHR